MAYLHCHNCDFLQDDFWDESYNPITYLENNYKKMLLEEDLDKVIQGDAPYFPKTNREYVADLLEKAAKKVRRMVYPTYEDFKRRGNNKWACPKCGEKALDID